jgi:hypothetical protein
MEGGAMITFTNLGIHGRLGNQLYQYAALRGAALRNNYVSKIPNYNGRIWHSQECLLSNFNIESEFLTEDDYKLIERKIVDQSNYMSDCVGYHFSSLENIKDNTDIIGFFQNTKYFSDFEEQIKKELSLKKSLADEAKMHVNKIKSKTGYSNLVALHVRTGDQIDGTHPDYHRYKKYYGNGPFDLEADLGKYIQKSIDTFPVNTGFLVFVGGSRTGDDKGDIAWANSIFNDEKFIISNTQSSIKDFALMQNCEHNIVSFYSTYSWWAAYTNPNPDKIIIAPRDYHMDGIYDHPNRNGFFPKDWNIY